MDSSVQYLPRRILNSLPDPDAKFQEAKLDDLVNCNSRNGS